MHDDFALVDRRRLGWPSADRDALMARRAEFGAIDVLVPEILEISERGWVGRRIEMLGDGEEIHDITVQVLDGTLTRWLELFEPDDLDAALARFAELTNVSESS